VTNKKIWHVYYGSRGTAGSYIDCLQKTALKTNLASSAFVSCRYRFKTKRVFKIFFPLTDRTEKRNFFIKALRYAELAMGYKIVFWAALFRRPIININLIDDLRLTYFFFRLLKFFKIKVFVTCHDVLSHHQGLTRKRSNMFDRADKLIVHSSYAHNTLLQLLTGKQHEKILRFPFPASPLDEILSPQRMSIARHKIDNLIGKNTRYFLFIGVVRQSKGIDTLLDAWEMSQARSTSKLVIAGKWNAPVLYLKKKAAEIPNCLALDYYLTDEEYVYLIRGSKFTVMPYKEYSHSAIFFSCAWNKTAVILSDAQLFTELLPGYDLMFPAGQSERLAGLLDRAAALPEAQVEHYRQIIYNAAKRINNDLQKQLKLVYGEL
jgi:glycosyltransferase involved in cell wall biosynthesis